MQKQDEDWFDDIDEKMISFKNKIHNWIRNAEHEGKERLSSKSRSVTSKHSSIIKFILEQFIKRQKGFTRKAENGRAFSQSRIYREETVS